MLVAQTGQTRQAVRDVVSESFVELIDGYFYPAEGMAQTALVRVYIAPTSYLIERRRKANQAWMPIVTAELAEFDADAFRAWREGWPTVQA